MVIFGVFIHGVLQKLTNKTKNLELVIQVLLWASSRTLGICRAHTISHSPSFLSYKMRL
jgi:hypothetical protein